MPWTLFTPNQPEESKYYQESSYNFNDRMIEEETYELLASGQCSVHLHSPPPPEYHRIWATSHGESRVHEEEWGSSYRLSTRKSWASEAIKNRFDIIYHSFIQNLEHILVIAFLSAFTHKAILQAPQRTGQAQISWRRFGVAFLLAVSAFLTCTTILFGALVLVYGGMPPSYDDIRLQERALPQHRWRRSLQNPHGFINGNNYEKEHVHGYENSTSRSNRGDERYLRFPNHLWGHGLNNVLQEELLYALLAHHSNRSYVFEDFVWSHLPLPYTLYDFTLRPTRIPMGAFLGGWLVGQNAGKEGQSHYQPLDRGKTREDEEERVSGPLIERVLGVSQWARALFGFQPELQQRQERGWRGSQLSPTTTRRPSPAIDDLSGFDSSLDNTSRKHTDGDSVPVSTVPSETRRRSPTLIRSSISAEYFEHVCPPSRRVEVLYTWPTDILLEGGDLGPSRQRVPEATADGTDILQWWTERLNGDDLKHERCVVIREEERRIWDSDFFGTRRPLSLFNVLKDSPVLSAFEWSPLVKGAVEKTIARFFNSSGSYKTLSMDDIFTDHIALRKDSVTSAAGLSNEYGGPYGSAAVSDSVASSDMGIHASLQRMSFDVVNATVDEPARGQIIQGVLAVHLRRGDYKRHCLRLSHWGAGYMGWNRLIDSPPKAGGGVGFEDGLRHFLMREKNPGGSAGGDIVPDLDAGSGTLENNEEWNEKQQSRKEAYYLQHCLPTIPQIVQRLREVREEYEATIERLARGTSTSSHGPDIPTEDIQDHRYSLREVYVLTNGWPSFMDEIRIALLQDGWEKVVGSVDIERSDGHNIEGPDKRIGNEEDRAEEAICPVGLSKEERGVNAAIDMGLAERAEVFVGNGFSSLSANIVLLRLAHGFQVHSSRML